jgi:hypothetical protein
MKLIEDLQALLAAEESLFRQQLLREDITRLRKLEALAKSSPDLDTLHKAGMRLGWTQGDARTSEIRAEVESLLKAVYAGDEAGTASAWQELHRARMERLLGCLSTPVPKPVE